MAFLANRDGFFSLFVENGDANEVAACTADTIVRDPVFAPVIEAAGNDPAAEPDSALVATVELGYVRSARSVKRSEAQGATVGGRCPRPRLVA